MIFSPTHTKYHCAYAKDGRTSGKTDGCSCKETGYKGMGDLVCPEPSLQSALDLAGNTYNEVILDRDSVIDNLPESIEAFWVDPRPGAEDRLHGSGGLCKPRAREAGGDPRSATEIMRELQARFLGEYGLSDADAPLVELHGLGSPGCVDLPTGASSLHGCMHPLRPERGQVGAAAWAQQVKLHHPDGFATLVVAR